MGMGRKGRNGVQVQSIVDIDLLVFYRGERFIPICLKRLYSMQSGPALACLPAKCHFAGRGGGGDAMIAQH